VRCSILLIALPLRLWPATAPPPVRDLNVGVAMRDGIRLSANVFRPAAPGRYPTVLLRTPYDKGDDITPNFQSFVNHGYAVVVQDVRGRYDSAGVFEPINQEINDGDDTLNWIARQAWSDGNVGMYGGSYLGIAQWKAALAHNPHLKAIFPYVSGDDDYRDRFYSPGGAMKLGHRLLWVSDNLRASGYVPPAFGDFIWSLPERNADAIATGHTVPLWQLASNHPTYDKFWKEVSVREHLKDIRVPVYSVGGWYDNYVESDLDAFSVLRKTNPEDRIMIGPWPHTFNTPFAKVTFGKDSTVPLRPEQLKWFDRWLKGNPAPEPGPPVRIFVMGVDKWRDEEEWPLARARPVKFYLGGDGHANTLYGDGILADDRTIDSSKHTPPDTFLYDPNKPVPTTGGAVCCDSKKFPWGPLDQRPVEKRHDVLVYTTAPLTDDLEITGPIKLILYAASTATDTDFTAKLVDVFPNGEARNLTDGILRARYRDSLEKAKAMNPGEVYRMTIDVGVTSNVFRAGHRIRLEVSSSNFPRFDRNPNTGRPVADETELVKATQTVFHDQERHSYLLLPEVPTPPRHKPASVVSTK
jgi:putative CocE/NonD family hydrolase